MRKFLNLIFILVLGGLSTFILSGVRSYTLPIIEEYAELSLKRNILEAAGIKVSEEDDLNRVTAILKENNIEKKEKNGFEYYLSSDERRIFGFTGRGLWGPIKVVISMNPDGKTIEKLRVVSQEETPGLGGRISEEGFLKKFEKKELPLQLVLRKEPEGKHEIDAISGATMTSQAFLKMINEFVKDLKI